MTEALISAIGFPGEAGAQPLDWQQALHWQREQGLLWIHLDMNHEATREWLEDGSGLSPLASGALLAEDTRPRTTPMADGALVILRGVNLNPGADPEDMVSIRLWVDGRRVVSVRKRRLLSAEDTADTLLQRGASSTGGIVTLLAHHMVNRMTDVIDGMDERVAELESRALEVPAAEIRTQLAEVRREAIALRRFLAPQRDALTRLHGGDLDFMTEHDRQFMREVSDLLIRHLENLEMLRERAALVHEEVNSHRADQLNSRMYVLSMVSVVFLPLGFLTGLLGINVGGIPGAENDLAFTYFGAGLALLVGMQIWFFRKKRWI